MNDFLSVIRLNLPNLCTVKHLIEFGIFSSEQTAYHARKQKVGPPFFKINRHIVYPREELIDYLQKHYHQCGN